MYSESSVFPWKPTPDPDAEVRPEWYVFYLPRLATPVATVEMIRISATCLGDATIVAKELAKRSEITIIGVCPDLGASEVS